MQEKITGSLFGTAYGDALAAPTEFIRDVSDIEKLFGKGGPAEPSGNPARVTDDTQMAIAVGEALLQAERPFTVATLERPLRKAFVTWMHSPDNNRAPGMTCMSACRRLEQGGTWQKATVINSKGCGANMRVGPVGLLPDVDPTTRAAIAQFQAALTHGHPTALAASDLTAVAIAELLAGTPPSALPALLKEYARSQENIYHEEWLGNHWQQVGVDSPEEFIRRGWKECLALLLHLEAAAERTDKETDPCVYTGEGWIAEEAFATGLLCFLWFPDDPVAALRRAAVTSGDSDSIACLTGAFAGAYYGMGVWPAEWAQRIEYKERLTAIANGVSNM